MLGLYKVDLHFVIRALAAFGKRAAVFDCQRRSSARSRCSALKFAALWVDLLATIVTTEAMPSAASSFGIAILEACPFGTLYFTRNL